MRIHRFKAFLTPTGASTPFEARPDMEELFERVADAVFERFEGDVTPALMGGRFVLQCEVRDSSREQANRQVFETLKRIFGDELLDGGIEPTKPARRRSYTFNTQPASPGMAYA